MNAAKVIKAYKEYLREVTSVYRVPLSVKETLLRAGVSEEALSGNPPLYVEREVETLEKKGWGTRVELRPCKAKTPIRFLLLDDCGSGKSSLLRQLAKETLVNEPKMLPLLLSGRDLLGAMKYVRQVKSYSFLELVAAYMLEAVGEGIDLKAIFRLRNELKKRRLYLLIDLRGFVRETLTPLDKYLGENPDTQILAVQEDFYGPAYPNIAALTNVCFVDLRPWGEEMRRYSAILASAFPAVRYMMPLRNNETVAFFITRTLRMPADVLCLAAESASVDRPKTDAAIDVSALVSSFISNRLEAAAQALSFDWEKVLTKLKRFAFRTKALPHGQRVIALPNDLATAVGIKAAILDAGSCSEGIVSFRNGVEKAFLAAEYAAEFPSQGKKLVERALKELENCLVFDEVFFLTFALSHPSLEVLSLISKRAEKIPPDHLTFLCQMALSGSPQLRNEEKLWELYRYALCAYSTRE